MTIHSFLTTLFIGLASGFLFGYFSREIASWIIHILDTHTEPSHLRLYRPDRHNNEHADANEANVKD